jgi:hypothetical protein
MHKDIELKWSFDFLASDFFMLTKSPVFYWNKVKRCLMHFVYFDEVKYQKKVLNYYLLCGIVIKDDRLDSLENEIDKISCDFFEINERTKATEFHARDIVLQKNIYEPYDESQRMDLYKKLLSLIKKYQLNLIDIKINVENLPNEYKIKNVQSWALIFMLENVSKLMGEISSKAFMVGDHDGEFSDNNINQFNDYKIKGTPGYKRAVITNVVDTLHYAYSINSRLLQLADIYTYIRMLSIRKKHKNNIAAEIVSYWEELNLKPVKAKNWPEQKM